MKNKILWITQTAVMFALLIGVQFVTRSFGQFVTGSLVNLILIVSVMVCGLSAGLTVAVISPVLAFFLGIGPKFFPIIPFQMAGNLTLVLIWFVICNRKFANTHIRRIITLITAAAGKFLILYIGVVKIALPFLLELPEQQENILAGMFSVPQLITALIGGTLAFALLPVLEKAVAGRMNR